MARALAALDEARIAPNPGLITPDLHTVGGAEAAVMNLFSAQRVPTALFAPTVDETRVSPAIDVKAFRDTPRTGRYWSATMASPRPADRWMLDYNDGVTTYRPVRHRIRSLRALT